MSYTMIFSVFWNTPYDSLTSLDYNQFPSSRENHCMRYLNILILDLIHMEKKTLAL